MSTKNSKVELESIKRAIKRVAEEQGLHPVQLTKAVLMGNSDVTDWQLRKYGGLANIVGANFKQEDKEIAASRELQTNKNYINKLERDVADREIYIKTVRETLEKTLKPVTVAPYERKKNATTKRALNLILSDLHFGSDIDGKETGNATYGKVEESRRFARVIKETIDYKIQYRDDTELNVLILGDIMQGQLHDMRDGAPGAEQMARCIYLLSQGLAQLSKNFPKVNVYFATGNHGRSTARHHGRATLQKWDSLETVIYYALKTVFANSSNMSFTLPLTPYVTYDLFNKKAFASHGDTVFNPGYPGKSINVSNLEDQTNRINASLKDDSEYSVFIVGHVHTASVTHLGNNSVMITNGALVPTDGYATSIGLLESNAGQMLFESVKDFPVGDTRFIRVSSKDDANKELDKIIKPFESL